MSYSNQRLLRKEHRLLHNENQLFYTLSPELLIAIASTFRLQDTNRLTDDYGYYEFGLFKGFSFWFAEQISRPYADQGFRFYGFDSFQGMPRPGIDKKIPQWSKGTYSASLEFVESILKQNGTDLSRIKLFKGYYFTRYFKQLEAKEKFPPASICVIDSDLYESCVPVLEFIGKHLVKGAFLIFDDYNIHIDNKKHGEARALQEYEERHPEFSKEYLFSFNPCGVVFRVISV